jgi:hypothetical protein
MRIDIKKHVNLSWFLCCPKCRNKLYPIGIWLNPFWCKECKQAYWFELRKSKHKENDLKDVVGFPNEQS